MASWLRRAAAGGFVAAFLATLPSVPILATASCEGHECDTVTTFYGCPSAAAAADPAACCGAGYMMDDSHWASTPQDADWVPFPSMGTVHLQLWGWTLDRVPEQAGSELWIGPAPPQGPADPYPADASPDAPASVTTLASGVLGEWPYFSHEGEPTEVEVFNDTCSPAVARVIVAFPDAGPITPEMMGPCWKRQSASASGAP